MLDTIFGNADVYAQAMDGLSLRQRALAQNVANVDTPGYKRFDVAYERQLRQQLKLTVGEQSGDEPDLMMSDARHFSLGPMGAHAASVAQITQQVYRNDQNNVDIEHEMAQLAETTVRYNTMTTLARNKFDGLKSLIREIR